MVCMYFPQELLSQPRGHRPSAMFRHIYMCVKYMCVIWLFVSQSEVWISSRTEVVVGTSFERVKNVLLAVS